MCSRFLPRISSGKIERAVQPTVQHRAPSESRSYPPNYKIRDMTCACRRHEITMKAVSWIRWHAARDRVAER